MNDPHVEALHYRVHHHDSVDYSKAEPLAHDEPGFSLHIEAGRLRVSMKEHYATEEAAREAVEPFLRAWKLDAALRHKPGELNFEFQHADIVDRDPKPGVAEVPSRDQVLTTDSPNVVVTRATYPDPPRHIARDADVDLMYERYRRYCDGRTTLAGAANYCLRALELNGGGRAAAAQKFGIGQKVLNRAGELAGTKGGTEARKPDGAQAEYTAPERKWLEAAMKAMIWRAAEVAYDPAASRRQITMADLPDL